MQKAPSPAYFKSFGFVNLKMMVLLRDVKNDPLNGNSLLDVIGEKCPQLESLLFCSWDKIKFDFLIQLPCLKSLQMLLAFEFPQRTLINLLKTHRNLANLDVCFVRSISESKDELSSLKEQVNETFAKRFEARKLRFGVEIYTNVDQFVRYVLGISHEPVKMDPRHQTRLFNFIADMKAKKNVTKKLIDLDRNEFEQLFD